MLSNSTVAIIVATLGISICLPLCVSAAAPIITTTTLPNGTAGQRYGPLGLDATSPSCQSFQWSLTSGQLPDGVTLNYFDLRGIYYLDGTPTRVGSFTFTLSVNCRDMSDRSSQTYTVTIPHPPPLMIDLVGSLGPFYVGDQIQTGFAAFGGAGPYTWVASGNIPTGLTFSGGGLMGTATTPGSYTFSVTVTDLVGTSTSQSYTISILLKVSLTASRGSLLFFYHEGTVPPASQSFTDRKSTRLNS